MQERSHALGRGPDIATRQFALAYTVNSFFAVTTIVEVVSEPRHLHRRQNDVFLVMILKAPAPLQVFAAALRAFVQVNINMLVDMIWFLARSPRMPFRRATLLRRRLLLILIGVPALVLLEELVAVLLELKLQKPVLFFKNSDLLGLFDRFMLQALTSCVQLPGFAGQALGLLVQTGHFLSQFLHFTLTLGLARRRSAHARGSSLS